MTRHNSYFDRLRRPKRVKIVSQLGVRARLQSDRDTKDAHASDETDPAAARAFSAISPAAEF